MTRPTPAAALAARELLRRNPPPVGYEALRHLSDDALRAAAAELAPGTFEGLSAPEIRRELANTPDLFTHLADDDVRRLSAAQDAGQLDDDDLLRVLNGASVDDVLPKGRTHD